MKFGHSATQSRKHVLEAIDLAFHGFINFAQLVKIYDNSPANDSFDVKQALRVTSAMTAGVSDHIWEIEELIGLLDGVRSN